MATSSSRTISTESLAKQVASNMAPYFLGRNRTYMLESPLTEWQRFSENYENLRRPDHAQLGGWPLEKEYNWVSVQTNT